LALRFEERMLDPVEKQSVAESVFRDLRKKIVNGEYAPGEALPGERALSKSLGVNRGAVRESLKRLSQLGLVEIQHGEHTRVTDFRSSGTLDLLGEILISDEGEVDLRTLRSLVMILVDAATLAARKAAPLGGELGPDLRKELATIESSTDDADATFDAAVRFWDRLFIGPQDVALRMLWNSLRRVVVPLGRVVEHSGAHTSIIAEHMRSIADAVTSTDPERAAGVVRAVGEAAAQLTIERIDARIADASLGLIQT